MTAEGSGTIRSRIKNLLRSPSIKLRRRSGNARHKEDRGDKAIARTRTHTCARGACQFCDIMQRLFCLQLITTNINIDQHERCTRVRGSGIDLARSAEPYKARV